MFSEEHLEQVISGEKTQTRRLWDTPRLKPGNSYRAVTNESGSLFTPREEAPAYVLVKDVYQEPLGDITEKDANAEGGYTRKEFIQIWEEINDVWDPETLVWVIEFVGSESDPR